MNQNQREYLMKHIDKVLKTKRDELTERKPRRPSLNNYLIAAVLDGTFQLQDAKTIRVALHSKVLLLGASDALVESSSRHYRNNEDDDSDTVSIKADELFILPLTYQTALAEYEAARATWDAEVQQLEDTAETIKLKIQIGSVKALDVLVEQADNLIDLNLVNTTLLLTGGDVK